MKIEGKWKQVNTVGTFLDLILQSDISTTDNTSHLYFRGESKYHDTIVPSIYLDEKLTLEGSEYYSLAK